jgi:hypothetical protein
MYCGITGLQACYPLFVVDAAHGVPKKFIIFLLTVTCNNITIITNKCSYIHYVY